MSQPFLTGVIEGFYGRPWPHEVRLAYAGILAAAGFNTCLYAPKSDAVLRRDWRGRWEEGERRNLRELADTYRANGVAWGVGLSPMELYVRYDAPQRDQLQGKVEYLLELGITVLAILFDDMPGDVQDLAARQAQIIGDVARWAPGVRLLMCPTYYSHDPVLEQYFGDMPADYWADLGAALPPGVGIFWTGNRVCSESVTVRDISAVNEAFGRRVTLWDNYPVNDGGSRADFLYLEPLSRRDPGLAGALEGHLCNPMNEGLLSLPALSGLARLYGTGDIGEDMLAACLGRQCWDRLKEDAALFSGLGLQGMGPDRREALAGVYRSLEGPAAAEVVDWLEGGYAFDPACLTG